jgi:predicted enzyme related to lactoylglutathione lyase
MYILLFMMRFSDQLHVLTECDGFSLTKHEAGAKGAVNEDLHSRPSSCHVDRIECMVSTVASTGRQVVRKGTAVGNGRVAICRDKE